MAAIEAAHHDHAVALAQPRELHPGPAEADEADPFAGLLGPVVGDVDGKATPSTSGPRLASWSGSPGRRRAGHAPRRGSRPAPGLRSTND